MASFDMATFAAEGLIGGMTELRRTSDLLLVVAVRNCGNLTVLLLLRRLTVATHRHPKAVLTNQ